MSSSFWEFVNKFHDEVFICTFAAIVGICYVGVSFARALGARKQ